MIGLWGILRQLFRREKREGDALLRRGRRNNKEIIECLNLLYFILFLIEFFLNLNL